MPRCLLFVVLKSTRVMSLFYQKYRLSNFKIQFTKNVESVSVTTVVFPLYSLFLIRHNTQALRVLDQYVNFSHQRPLLLLLSPETSTPTLLIRDQYTNSSH